MKKDIYKITNLINGKCYIGQTSNAKRRFTQHKNYAKEQEDSKLLYYAFRKYGIKNFSFEVIQSQIENYNERQIYWINYYNSYENGYNQTFGGENPPLHVKEDNPFATHTQQEVNKVINMILNTNKTLKQIAEETGYDYSTISRIQLGILWHDDNLSYPLRPQNGSQFKKDRAEMIIEDLLYTNLSQKEIAEKYNCARSTVTAINLGKNNHHTQLIYPLRQQKRYKDYTKNICMLDPNTQEVLKTFKSLKQAGNFLNTTGQTIAKCLKGEQKLAYNYKWKYEENN